MVERRSDVTENARLVLYGTLRRGSERYDAFDLEARLTFLGECTLEGVLYDLGEYPGLVLASELGDAECDGSNGSPDATRVDPTLVTGELYRVDDGSVVRDLDRIEGYDPAIPEHSLYVRQQVRLAEPPVEAWTYVYNWAVGDATVIQSGDWRAYTGD